MEASTEGGSRRDLAHWVILVAGAVYAVGVGLLAVAVYVDLPGFLGAYGDPEAWWPIAVNLAAGLLSFGTWRWVNRRNSRPFAVVLLGLGIATVLVLASASYARCPDAGLSTGWSVVTRVVGPGHQQLRDRHVRGARAATPDGVPLALQFARLTQLIVLLVAATSALAALLRTQVDRVAVRWSPRLSVVLGLDADVGAAAARPGHRLRALHAGGAHHRPAGAVGRAGARGGLASGDHRPEPGGDAGPAARPPAAAGTRCADWPCWPRTAPRRSA